MHDYIWFIMTCLLFVLLGFLFIRLGLQIWKKQRMDLIISYHSDKVSEENKRAYCTLTGIGMLIMGAGFLLSGICTIMIRSFLVFLPMTAGLLIGTIMLITAGMKYNH
ncbi:MAG: DUF3784 domain-containing protein [Solobacterium sp.]|nr:DUF3784 domain-containing protein [Solobacterium sp.]